MQRLVASVKKIKQKITNNNEKNHQRNGFTVAKVFCVFSVDLSFFSLTLSIFSLISQCKVRYQQIALDQNHHKVHLFY